MLQRLGGLAPSECEYGVAEPAVELAGHYGALAIEGFPFARGAKLSRESMVGVQATFEACGFAETRRPSPTRVVMRRELRR